MAANVEPEKTHVVRDLKHGKPLIACRFDPIGRYVFAASEDETIERWDLNVASASPATPAVTYAAHDGWCFALALSPDGRTLLTGGTDGKLIWWPADGPSHAAAGKDHGSRSRRLRDNLLSSRDRFEWSVA